MLKNILLIAVALFSGSVVHAQAEKQSEMFYQVPAGRSALTPRVAYLSAAAQANGATSESKMNGLYRTGVAYEYGLSEMLSIEGSLYYTSIENDSTPKSKMSGFEDPQLSLKGTTAMADSRLRFGAALGLGLEKSKVKTKVM